MVDTQIRERRQQRRAEAGEEYNRLTQRRDGLTVATSLAEGLNVLRDGFFIRIYNDVERSRGADSVLMPISPVVSETRAKAEIELYMSAESAAAARAFGWIQPTEDWYLPWLVRLRLGPTPQADTIAKRLIWYAHHDPDQRRLTFSELLERAFPEARYAPLVMYRLLPLAVGVATALAFRDHLRANELRNRQIGILPAIGYCQDCHGRPPENGELCKRCGNPWWKVEWLTADG